MAFTNTCILYTLYNIIFLSLLHKYINSIYMCTCNIHSIMNVFIWGGEGGVGNELYMYILYIDHHGK